MAGSDPADIGMQAIIEAIKKGLPITVKKLDKRALLVIRERSKGVLYASLVESSEGGDECSYVVLDSDYVSVWGVKVALICRGEIKEYYPYMVPMAVKQHPHLLSPFEADIWSRRIALSSKLRPIDKYPEVLRPFRVLGADIMYLDETMDYAAVRNDGVILAWYNEFTGRLDDATKYLAAMGLL
ncbi:hypothetical protein PYJP_17910 [Pyrofollis japonicus]|uniref:hypothetical protein n=1 Tax=Pyrofollis japonicus TaxID=3060460 RepID=UPI00295B298D|nr:hypothetical protein [Pyrofollis japonicus]BEP18439.1 hypothetical protein PYJP_17910 [Pyrofollis japonicus]